MTQPHSHSSAPQSSAPALQPAAFHGVGTPTGAQGPLAIRPVPWAHLAEALSHSGGQRTPLTGPLIGGGDLQVVAFDRMGTVASPHGANRGWRTLIARITAFEAGAGKYAAHLLFGDSSAAANENVTLPEGLSDSGNNNALVVNMAEAGIGHQLPLESVQCGIFAGMTAESPARAIVLVHNTGPVLQPVQVMKDGGTDGNQTAAATWTYTIFSLDGSLTFASQTPLTRPRPAGSSIPPSANPAYGLAFVDASGTWRLWDAGEIPATTPCS